MYKRKPKRRPLSSYERSKRYKERYPERVKTAQQRWKANNPDKVRNSHLLRKYGITLAEFDAMFENQDGVCAICHQPEFERQSLCVDHNHSTGQVRQLLCVKCNSVLGMVDDSIEYLQEALDYLIRHRE